MSGPLVVVGGGLAGARAATALASAAKGRPVVLVGAEDDLPYHRPGLTKEFLLQPMRPAELALYPDDHYRRLGIDVRLGAVAESLDPVARQVVVGAERLDYDRLLIATGGTARRLAVPGAELAGVQVLRSLRDAVALRQSLRPPTRLVVIGAGFLGLELAGAARALGLDVTVVEAAGAPLEPLLGHAVGERFRRLHDERGVAFVTGASLVAFEGRGAVRRVVLADGTALSADVVVVAVGITPNTGWLAGSGLHVDDGVVVDDLCRTSDEFVYAAGDVCRWTHPTFGSVRVEHETHAQNQALSAARAILGRPRPYRAVPYVWSVQHGHDIRYVGHARAWDDLVVLDEGDGSVFAALYLAGGEVRGVLTVGRNDLSDLAMKAMRSGLPLRVRDLTG